MQNKDREDKSETNEIGYAQGIAGVGQKIWEREQSHRDEEVATLLKKCLCSSDS